MIRRPPGSPLFPSTTLVRPPAAGIRAGAGDDEVWNGGAIDVRSTASLSLSSSSFTFGGTGGTDGSLTASTQSTGIAGGKGRDSIMNEGELNVSSTVGRASCRGRR